MPVHELYSRTVMENWILCKGPTRLFDYYNYDAANPQELACWILLKLELEPASLKIRRTGGDAS